ncbi:MAG: radical SAM protein [Nitrospirae bacterium]|nr:radical SAM protein [Nitrospirota bacterium]MCL5976733.1 radical SAM protein [Nitrospirota bacterium]
MNSKEKSSSDILQWQGERLIPKRVTIETIFGCNAKCVMCVIDHPTDRKKRIMQPALFYRIVDNLTEYKDHIEMFDLFGLGEPLLDPYIFERIGYVKGKGFRRLAISTNADLLDADKQMALLDTGIETVLFSIDGISKATHESIRHGVSYERVVDNIQSIIRMRDDGGFPTRFIVRFIKQPINMHELESWKMFWASKISKSKGDLIAVYNMHSWGGEVASKDQILGELSLNIETEKRPCHHIFYNMIILSDGSMPLCSEDFLKAQYGFGNISNNDIMEIYNSEKFNRIREVHISGNKVSINPCKECTVLYSEASRVYV